MALVSHILAAEISKGPAFHDHLGIKTSTINIVKMEQTMSVFLLVHG